MTDAPPAPQISVIMSVFNGGRHLAPAVDSILSQTLGDFEFLIFDDGSTDGSSQVLAEQAQADRRVSLERLEHQGLTNALNHGLHKARGTFIARMDADDISHPERFARQVRYLEAHPEVAVVSGAFELIDEDNCSLKTIIHPVLSETVRRELAFHNIICHPLVMARRAAMLEAGGYRRQYMHAEDYDMWLRMAQHHDLANLPDVLLRYRQHANKVSWTGYAEQLISVAVARRAAELRRQGASDPTDAMQHFSLSTLEALGTTAAEVRRARGEWFRSLFLATGDGRFPVARLASFWIKEGRRIALDDADVDAIVKTTLFLGLQHRKKLHHAAMLFALVASYYPVRVMVSSYRLFRKHGLRPRIR